jgi:hypothetical protein
MDPYANNIVIFRMLLGGYEQAIERFGQASQTRIAVQVYVRASWDGSLGAWQAVVGGLDGSLRAGEVAGVQHERGRRSARGSYGDGPRSG